MSRSILAGIAFGFLLVTGPLPGQGVAATSTELPSVALPPELDRVLRDYERGWRAGDAVALAALFAEDGFVLQSNRQPIRGRAAIRTVYEGQGGGPLRLRALAFATGDTVGYIIGAYGYDNAPGDTGSSRSRCVVRPASLGQSSSIWTTRVLRRRQGGCREIGSRSATLDGWSVVG